jgi:CRISPR-associated protein Cmr3
MTAASSWLAFTPRDTVFVRDGRSFNAAADALGQTVRPGPTTIAGAAGAAFGAEPSEVRGPVLACGEAGGWEPYFPVPADLVVTAEEPVPYVFRLRPVEVDGQTDLGFAGHQPTDGSEASALQWLMPPDSAGPVDSLTGWIPGRVLSDYLAGNLPAADGTAQTELGLADPLLPERRVGLARDEDRRVRTGYLYQSTHLRSHEGWTFLAECVFPPGWDRRAASPIWFGGRGRQADVDRADARWPDGLASVKQRVLAYLATPAVWPHGWRIPLPPGARLIGAATGDPEPAATLARGNRWRETRALRWAVPAGSVYLLEFADAVVGAEWAAEVHGTAYGCEERLRTAGFGVVLTGVWT